MIVDEPDMPEGANDITLVADDWRLTEDYALHEDSFGSLMDWSHQGRLGNWLTVNGKTDPSIAAAAGTARLRMINAANARTLAFRLQDVRPLRVIALDGAPCDPFDIDTIRLAPAQRADLLVELEGGEIALEEVSTGDPITAARLNVDGRAPLSHIPAAKSWYPRPDVSGALEGIWRCAARCASRHISDGARGTRRPGLHRRQSRTMAVPLSHDGAPCRRHGRCDHCRLTMFAVGGGA